MYLDLIHKHDAAERRFTASLHGVQLPDDDGRVRGIRQQQMQRMKARRGGH
jgi:hypothetical protein